MFKTREGSTGRLIQLCIGYFFFYVITGVTVKYFTGKPELGLPGMKDVEFLTYSTYGGMAICLLVAVALGWYRLHSNGYIKFGPIRIPQEFLYIIPSGICTAVVIPTTTLMYTLPISVMVAMVIMRASVIVISRTVDALQIRQSILRKKVYKEENWAVVFALCAASVHLVWVGEGDFDFVHSPAAVTILSSYIVAYAFRIYIMNYYKNTRAKGVKLDNNGFFAVEQITATIAIGIISVLLFYADAIFGWTSSTIDVFRTSLVLPKPVWTWAFVAGMAFGGVAFFSVFIFMFKGRTATFAGLVNRLTSLVAGITATLLSSLLLGSSFPKIQDWISLAFILVAVGFLTVAERKRSAELTGNHQPAFATLKSQ